MTPTITEGGAHTESGAGRFAYQPPLDGLRAVAVSVVVLYHLDASWMRGGFLGVDAFFVLSGFLITSLLLAERSERDTTQLSAFWSRRARRLLPAALLMIVVVTWYGGTVTPVFQLDALRGDAISGIAYVANWNFIDTGRSYFDLFTAPSPFQHLWSLAIEEQFYVVWPLVFVLVARTRRARRTLLVTALMGAAAAQFTMILLWDSANPSRAYFATPARLNGILLGAALAAVLAAIPLLPFRIAPPISRWGGALAAVVCVAAWVRATPSWLLFHGGDTLFALAVVGLILAIQVPGHPLARILAVRPLVWLGGLSYAVYLWHWPVIVYLDADRVGLSGVPLDLVRVGVTIVLAVVSGALVERRVQRSRTPVLLWVVPATVVCIAVVLVATAGAQQLPDFTAFQPGHACPPPSGTDVTTASRALQRGGVPDVPRLAGVTVSVIGDSRACSLLPGLEAAKRPTGVRVGDGAVLGCGVVAERFDIPGFVTDAWRNACPGAARRGLARVRAGSDILVWWSTWEGEDLLVGSRVVRAGTDEHDALVRDRMERWLASAVRPGTQIAIVLTPMPTADPARPQSDDATRAQAVAKLARLNRIVRDFAATHPDRVTAIDLDHFLCDGRADCPFRRRGVVMRPDGEHLGAQAAGIVTRWLLPQLATVRTSPASAR